MHFEVRCTRFLERLLGRLEHAVGAEEVRRPADCHSAASSLLLPYVAETELRPFRLVIGSSVGDSDLSDDLRMLKLQLKACATKSGLFSFKARFRVVKASLKLAL